MTDRINALCAAMKNTEGALIITDELNRRYLTGFSSTAGALIVVDGKSYFIIDSRYVEAARAAIEGTEVILERDRFAQTAEILKKHHCVKALLEYTVSVAQLDVFREKLPIFVDASALLSETIMNLRSIKSADEIECIEHAQSITERAFNEILKFIRPGLREIDVACELEHQMRLAGAERFAFETICVAGSKGSMPHGVPGDNIIENGDFLTMDFGAVWGGYCSDMTRTVAVGKVSDEQKKVYETVLAAQSAALAAARPGMAGKELDAVARKLIGDAGYGENFGHGLGHSLGLQVHENPRANTVDETPMAENMLMTVEPGIYLDGRFGVRIEDMIVFTAEGSRDLTGAPRELITL